MTSSEPKEQDEEPDRSRGAICKRWAKQIFLNLIFCVAAMGVMIRGTTLQDLMDIYQIDTQMISYTFLIGSLGGIVGSVIMGLLLHKLPKLHFTILIVDCIFMALANALFPHCGKVWILLVLSGVIGLGMGAAHTALNVICLEIWHGFNSGPHMHSLHLSMSIGGFLAPILSKPFLGQLAAEKTHPNGTITVVEAIETNIGTLYPIGALIVWAVCICGSVFIVREIIAIIKHRRARAETKEDKPAEKASFFGNDVALVEKWCFLTCILIFFAFYVSSEFSVMCYLPTFGVESDLNLSRKESADIMAYAMFPFVMSRLLGIFLAIKIRPVYILVLNLSLALIGNTLFSSRGFYDKYYLIIGCAVTGFGNGSMFANTIMWVEQYIPVKGRVGAAINVAAGVGILMAPILIGGYIETIPMILPYYQISITVFSILIFCFAGGVIGRRILRLEAEAKKTEHDEDAQEELKSLEA